MSRSQSGTFLVALAACGALPSLAQSTPAASINLGNVTLDLTGRVYGFVDAASGQNHPLGASEAVRLFPGLSFVNGDGVKFGALADVREGAATGPAPDIRDGQFYTRRLFVYASSANFGTLRLGTIDGASQSYQLGTFDTGSAPINDGGWNGIAHYAVATAVNPAWPFATSRFYYATNKLVYLSPRWDGVDFAVSYEPGVHGLNINQGGHYRDGSNSDFADAANSNETGVYRHNTVDALVHYYQPLGDASVSAAASYVVSGQQGTSVVPGVRYQGLSFFDLSGNVSYAGFTVGAMVQHGKFNGEWELSPQGAADSTAYSLGATYKIASYSLGVSYFSYRSPGALVPGSRLEQGISAGFGYDLSKNVSFYADYLNGRRQQTGYDFWTGITGSGADNSVETNLFTVGGKFNW